MKPTDERVQLLPQLVPLLMLLTAAVRGIVAVSGAGVAGRW